MSNDRSDVPSSLDSTAQYVLWLPSCHTLRIYKTSASSWGTSFVNSKTARWLLACTQQTQNMCITFVQCWSNVKTLGQRCTNVIQMFCVWWVAYRYNMFYKEITRIFTWLIVRNWIILHMWVISPYRQDRHGPWVWRWWQHVWYKANETLSVYASCAMHNVITWLLVDDVQHPETQQIQDIDPIVLSMLGRRRRSSIGLVSCGFLMGKE